ncbi:MAG: multiheme c-type cytochrome [Planctomycetota bacterium]
MKRARPLVLYLVLLVSSVATLAADEPSRLTILFTGEQMGRLAPCGCTEDMVGGLPRRSTFVRELRRNTGGEIVLLDNGGLVLEGGRQQEIKYEYTLLALGEMGYNACAVGFRDFALGLSTLNAQAVGSPVPLILSNARRRDGGFPFERSIVIELPSGRRVAVFAILGEAFRIELSSMAPDLELLDPVATARELVAELRPRADLVVLLCHAGAEEAKRIAREAPGIDVAARGYLEEKPPEAEEKVGATAVVGTGLYGKWVARLDVDFDPSGAVLGTRYTPTFLSGDMPEDKSVAELLADYRLQVSEEGLIDRFPRMAIGDRRYLGLSGCARCHLPQFRKWRTVKHEEALASLEKEGADRDPECVVCHTVGLENEGGFRSRALTPDLANVACEACHGPGSRHLRNVLAPYSRPDESKCRTCHDPENSPKFEFDTYYPKIDHRNAVLRLSK